MVCSVALNPVLDWTQEEGPLAVLVSRVAGGDEHALAQLYDRTSRIVYGLALRILGDAGTAEDITLEVYTQIWRTADSYSSERGTVNAWLVTLVRSRAIDWLRSRRNRSRAEQPLEDFPGLQDSRPNPETLAFDSGRVRLVQEAVAGLPQDQRHLIELAFFSGLTHSEIARRTELPLGTVKTRIRLGMGRLRDLLGTQGGRL